MRIRRLVTGLALAACLGAGARDAGAHPAPFSYLDLLLTDRAVTGSIVVHDFDAAHDLGVASPDELLSITAATRFRDPLVALLTPRLTLTFDGRDAPIAWQDLEVLPDRQSLRLSFTMAAPRPGRIGIHALIFPYDPTHQTFVNVYESGTLAHQAILDADHRTLEYYGGTPQGRWAVVRTFVASGFQHILIGPDHILFLVGLLLLGGSVGRLAGIVTAFTIGHSITLSLAALDIVSPPARFVEPLIALTIVIVGADNLLVIREAKTGGRTSDIRASLAAGFGLVHGFGFASVLKEFGLPRAALGWSLFSFNLGVEMGQLALVVVVAGLLTAVRRRSARAARSVAIAGSIGVILAGLYWFVDRVFVRGVQ